MKQINKKIWWLLLSGIIILCAVIFGSLFYQGEDTQDEIRYVRKNIHTPEAQSDIEALNKAMKIMREKDCSDPLSWYYQSSMHWVPDTINKNGLCSSYQNISQLKENWNSCTHTKGSEIHFLVWHRLYIYHFEKIVRKLSGKKDFALPYWGYTNQGSEQKILQSMFRNNNSSLYEACRFDSLNMGYPISGEGARALDITQLFDLTTYESFNSAMDAAPHGAMHDYIGAGNDTSTLPRFNNPITGTLTPSGLMGWVPTAAFDPVFWTHHSNIDRLWQQWTNSNNGQLVTLEDLNSFPWVYSFFDENGKKVTYTNEEIIKIIYDLDYDFDDTKVQSKEMKLKSVRAGKHVTASEKPLLSVNKQVTNVKVIKPKSTTKDFVTLKVKIKVVVSFTKMPKGTYEVYVNQPNGKDRHPSNEYFVGFMNFFGSDHKTIGSTCNKGCCGDILNGKPTKTFTFEVDASDVYNISLYKYNNKHTGNLVIESIEISQ